MTPTTASIIKKLKQKKLVSYMQEHNIKHIRLAGSFSRWEQNTDSDIDIVYEEFDSSNPSIELLSMPKILQSDYFWRSVDLLYKNGINRHIRESVLNHMIPIW